MAIRFECEACGRNISAPDEAAGEEGTCPQCEEVMVIPEGSTRKGSNKAGERTRPIRRAAGGGRRRGGRGGGRGAPPSQKQEQLQAWHIVLLVIGLVGGLGILIFALSSGGSKSQNDDIKVGKGSAIDEKTDSPEDDASQEPTSGQPKAGDGDGSKGGKKKPRQSGDGASKKKRKPVKNPVREIPYTEQAEKSKQLERTLVTGEQRSALKAVTSLPKKVALPILLNAFRQISLDTEDGNGRGNFIQSLLIEVSRLDEKAPVYDPRGNAKEREKCRKEWFAWYLSNKDNL